MLKKNCRWHDPQLPLACSCHICILTPITSFIQKSFDYYNDELQSFLRFKMFENSL